MEPLSLDEMLASSTMSGGGGGAAGSGNGGTGNGGLRLGTSGVGVGVGVDNGEERGTFTTRAAVLRWLQQWEDDSAFTRYDLSRLLASTPLPQPKDNHNHTAYNLFADSHLRIASSSSTAASIVSSTRTSPPPLHTHDEFESAFQGLHLGEQNQMFGDNGDGRRRTRSFAGFGAEPVLGFMGQHRSSQMFEHATSSSSVFGGGGVGGGGIIQRVERRIQVGGEVGLQREDVEEWERNQQMQQRRRRALLHQPDSLVLHHQQQQQQQQQNQQQHHARPQPPPPTPSTLTAAAAISSNIPPRLASGGRARTASQAATGETPPLPPYKSVLCRTFMATGKCFRQRPETCWFAHGHGELKDAQLQRANPAAARASASSSSSSSSFPSSMNPVTPSNHGGAGGGNSSHVAPPATGTTLLASGRRARSTTADASFAGSGGLTPSVPGSTAPNPALGAVAGTGNGAQPVSPSPKAKARSALDARLYKTEMCKFYEAQGECKFAEQCTFAHGQDELRPVPSSS